jgi:Tol biopolymer transport system component
VNVATDGTQADQSSFAGGAISGDGRFVAFESFADTLVPGDTNDATDVFVRDNRTGTTERVSVAGDEGQGDTPAGVAGAGRELDISPDGRYVVFNATFDDLVPGGNSRSNVDLRDRVAGTTEIVSIADNEAVALGHSTAGAVSADGRYVAFTSSASNLVTGDTNGVPCDPHEPHCDIKGHDVFVRDRVNGTTERVSVASDESQADEGSAVLRMSDDGRYVAFTSVATTLVPVDTSDNSDIFVRDRTNGTTELVSVAFDGTGTDGANFAGDMSSDGRFVTFMSDATDLVDGDVDDPFLRRHIYLRDRSLNATERIDVTSAETTGNREPQPESAVNGDGNYVVFASFADNLISGDTNGGTDLFMRDRALGTLERVSLTHLGGQPSDTMPPAAGPFSTVPDMSDDGRYIAFSSQADNLVPGDTNGLVTDVFARFVLAPMVDSVTPSAMSAGHSQLTVEGARFLPGVTVVVTGGGITVDGVTRVDASTLLVDVTVADGAATGTRTLKVTNPGTGPGAGAGGSNLCGCIAAQ